MSTSDESELQVLRKTSDTGLSSNSSREPSGKFQQWRMSFRKYSSG